VNWSPLVTVQPGTLTTSPSLSPWLASAPGSAIRSGGGFSDQRDHAALTVTWESQAGEALSHATIGPVSPGQRRNTSGTLYRATSGVVPRTATTAVVSLVLTREDGVYDDGYADNLGLTIARRA
jgi:hypothetical protein